MCILILDHKERGNNMTTIKTKRENEVEIKTIDKMSTTHNGYDEEIKIVIKSLVAVLPNGNTTEIYSVSPATQAINSQAGSFFTASREEAETVKKMQDEMTAKNKEIVRNQKNMKLNPDWVDYNNAENEGGEGYNLHPKYI
jgi:hypothetical protein